MVVRAVVGGVAGYIGGQKLVDAAGNALSTGPQGQGALQEAFASRRAEDNRQQMGIVPGAGSAGMSMVDSGAQIAQSPARRDVANKAPLFNPTVEELGAIGALQPTAAQALAAPGGQPAPAARRIETGAPCGALFPACRSSPWTPSPSTACC